MRKIIPFVIYALLLNIPLAIAQDKDKVKLAGHWEGKNIPNNSTYNHKYMEVWGFTVGEKEYGVIGSTIGTHIIDVTDPKNAKEVAQIPGKANGASIVHRDYHDYNGYLYMVADEGSSSLQIAKISDLPSTGKAPVVYNSDELLVTSHNIFVDSTSGLLYACGVANKTGGRNHLEVYSLENPEKPKAVKDFNLEYYHDVYVRNGIAYGNCGDPGFYVVDFTNPASPKKLGQLTSYPDKGYNHSGWTTEDGKYYFLADENPGMKIKTLDVSDPTDIKSVTTFGSEVDPKSMLHNLIVKGHYLYVSYYHDGFYVFDIQDPARPTLAGFYDTYTPTDHSSFKGAWGVYPFLPSGNILISDMNSGLYIFDVSDIVTGIEDSQATEYTKEKLLIQFNQNTNEVLIINRLAEPSNYNIQLVDMAGKVVNEINYQFPVHGKKTITVNSNLEKGVYFVRMFNNDYSQSHKFVKVN